MTGCLLGSWWDAAGDALSAPPALAAHQRTGLFE
ncbi:hypothetical protein M2271_007983 [Streptomyces sp. LBL]|nr:hypothetical protein [Streptomyces sp. LBL]